jgi:hypothetical protein
LPAHCSFALNFSVQNEQRARLEIAQVLKEVEAEREKQEQMKQAHKALAKQREQLSHTLESPLAPLQRFENIAFDLDEEEGQEGEEGHGGEDEDDAQENTEYKAESTAKRIAHSRTSASSPSLSFRRADREGEENVDQNGGSTNEMTWAQSQRFSTASPLSASTSARRERQYFAPVSRQHGKTGKTYLACSA